MGTGLGGGKVVELWNCKGARSWGRGSQVRDGARRPGRGPEGGSFEVISLEYMERRGGSKLDE